MTKKTKEEIITLLVITAYYIVTAINTMWYQKKDTLFLIKMQNNFNKVRIAFQQMVLKKMGIHRKKSEPQPKAHILHKNQNKIHYRHKYNT